MNIIEGTTKRDKLTGTEMNDRFYMSEGKDKIKNFDLANDVLVFDPGVDYDLKVRGNNVIVFGDGFKTIIKGVDCTDSLMITTDPIATLLYDVNVAPIPGITHPVTV